MGKVFSFMKSILPDPFFSMAIIYSMGGTRNLLIAGIKDGNEMQIIIWNCHEIM